MKRESPTAGKPSHPDAPVSVSPAVPPWASAVFALLTLGLVLIRFLKFRRFLDEPHAFRQAWTSNYTLSLFSGDMNIFLPSVASLGNYRHLLIEFPLPEWITAFVYHVTAPTLLVDRLVSIVFFLASAFFLFRAVTIVQDRLLAWIVTLIYLAAPLGIYYSRAVHIDSAALCFGHALLYYFLRYGETGRRGDLLKAGAASMLGFLVKAPYVFYLILPALYIQVVRGHRRRAAASAATFSAALIPALFWYAYAFSVNQGLPDLSFVPGSRRASIQLGYYVGTIERRLTPFQWGRVMWRILFGITVLVWWVLVPLALVWRRRFHTAVAFAAVWTLGSLVFLFLFFGAHTHHDYYQLNFIAPFALWMAIPLYRCLIDRGPRARLMQALGVGLLVAYAASGVVYAMNSHFYQIDDVGMRVGRFVSARTTQNDLVIMAFNEAQDMDPRYLYYATRRGWSVYGPWLDVGSIEGLKAHGATVVVTSEISPPPEATRRYLEGHALLDVMQIDGKHVFIHRIN